MYDIIYLFYIIEMALNFNYWYGDIVFSSYFLQAQQIFPYDVLL